MPGNDNTTPPTPRKNSHHETLLSTARRLSNDPNARDEHHLASLAILSRMMTTTGTGTGTTTTKSIGTTANGVGGSNDGVSAPSSSRSSSLPPPDPRDVEYALGHGGLDFLTRLVSTYVSSVRRKRGRNSVDVDEEEAIEDTGRTDGGDGGRADRSDDTTTDAYLSLAISVVSYLASEESPGCRVRVLPAVFDAKLMSRLIDALSVRAEIDLPLEDDVDGRILSVFTGAAVHLSATVETEYEGEGNDRVENIEALLPRCAEASVSRLFHRPMKTTLPVRDDEVEGDDAADGSRLHAQQYYYSEEGLASFLRSYLILVRTRTRTRRRRHTHDTSTDSSQSLPPLLLPPTSTLLDLLEMSSSPGGCSVDLHELSLLWITEVLAREVAIEGRSRTKGDEGGHGGLVDLLSGADDRRASNALRRCILLGIMGMTVTRSSDEDDSKSKSRQRSPLTTTDGDGDGAAARMRNAAYGTLAVAMEVCGGRWLLDHLANDGTHHGSVVGSGSPSALVRMACGELRIVLEGATTTSTSTSTSPTSSGSSAGRCYVGSLDLEVASNCVRVIVATVGLLVQVSSSMDEDDSSTTTPSTRRQADWEELLNGHDDGINSLLEIRRSLNGALGSCLTFLASMPSRTGRPHVSGEGRNDEESSRVSSQGLLAEEEREVPILGLLCSRCVGALLAETEIDEVVASVASASSSTDGEGGAVAVVADALRNAVVLCRRPRIDGATTTTEGEEESAAKASSSTAAADWGEPLALLPALAKMLAPDGDGDAGSSPVAERLAGDRVVLECIASYVRGRMSSSSSPLLNPPDGDEVADYDAMDTNVEAGYRGGGDDTAAAVEETSDADVVVDVNNPPHAGLRWALLVMERWWWWHKYLHRHGQGRGGDRRGHRGRSSTDESKSPPSRRNDDDEGGGEAALPHLLLGAVAECAGDLSDRVVRTRSSELAGARREEGGMAAGDEGNDYNAQEEREDRISLCVAIQTWFSILDDDGDDDTGNGTMIRADGPTEEDGGGLRPRGGFHDITSLAGVAKAMQTTFALPVPCGTDAKPEEEALALEVARTAATVVSSLSGGRGGFDRIVRFGDDLDGASIEELWTAVGRWSHRVRD